MHVFAIGFSKGLLFASNNLVYFLSFCIYCTTFCAYLPVSRCFNEGGMDPRISTVPGGNTNLGLEI